MIHAYSVVGDAIYEMVSAIDISEVYEEGWAHTFNRIFTPEELSGGGYPAFTVIPAEDEGSTLDSRTDTDRIVYWVVISFSQEEAIRDGEGNIRALVDLVRNTVKQQRASADPFTGDAYNVQVSGIWGWDTERSERFYRLVITVNVAQDLN